MRSQPLASAFESTRRAADPAPNRATWGLAAGLAVGLLLAVGCDNEARDAHHAAIEEMYAGLPGEDLPASRQRMALERFLAKFPAEHDFGNPRAAEAQARLAALQSAVAAKETAAAERRQARRDALVKGPIDQLLGHTLWDTISQGRAFKDNRTRSMKDITLTLGDDTLKVDWTYAAGVAVLRSAFLNLLRKAEVGTDAKATGSLEARAAHLWKTRGVPGLDGKDARYDPAAVKTLLDKLWVEPDAELLGVKARDLYVHFRDAVRTYAKLYVVMQAAGGRAHYEPGHLAAVEKGKTVKAVPSPPLRHYRQLLVDEGLDVKAAVLNRTGIHVAVGFWIRRMVDGTDAPVFAFVERLLKTYDPAFHESVIASGVLQNRKATDFGRVALQSVTQQPMTEYNTRPVKRREVKKLDTGLDPFFRYEVEYEKGKAGWMPGWRLVFPDVFDEE